MDIAYIAWAMLVGEYENGKGLFNIVGILRSQFKKSGCVVWSRWFGPRCRCTKGIIHGCWAQAYGENGPQEGLLWVLDKDPPPQQ